MNNTTYPATLLCDFYKISHREQYPKDTKHIYATWTPRTSRIKGIDKVVCFGLQGFIKEYLMDYFHTCFFLRKEEDVVNEYVRIIKNTLGKEEVDASHIIALHRLGYLPVEIKAVPEGTLVPIRVPMFTIENTLPEFFWVTNYLETLMSCMLWQPMTSATIALEYRKILQEYAIKTTGSDAGVEFQGHDFSMRGMGSLETAKSSGAGHLLSFCGTDTIPAILYHEEYYNANVEKELVGTSIPATEHSVQCAYGQEDEIAGYKRLINEIYPTGIASIVSDTWDLWHVITNHLPLLKEDIMSRDGKIVIRPDSGDPVEIICGKKPDMSQYYKSKDMAKEFSDFNLALYDTATYIKKDARDLKKANKLSHMTIEGGLPESISVDFLFEGIPYKVTCDMENEVCSYKEIIRTPEEKGVIELLWEIFGGTTTDQGYKLLDSHIGCIYGDAITRERCKEICDRLAVKGFASTNMVYGIGSFTYQYNTRDTFGFALKTTYAVVGDEERFLFKNPVTDNGTKKSQRGKVIVIKDSDGNISYQDDLNSLQEKNARNNMLEVVFKDGKLLKETSLREIRESLSKEYK